MNCWRNRSYILAMNLVEYFSAWAMVTFNKWRDDEDKVIILLSCNPSDQSLIKQTLLLWCLLLFFTWYFTLFLTLFKNSDFYLPSRCFHSLSVSICHDSSSILWPMICLLFHSILRMWMIVTDDLWNCSVFIFALTPLMNFAPILYDSVCIFFTSNLSWSDVFFYYHS